MVRRTRKQVADQSPTAPPSLATLREELYGLADPADAVFLQRFFKTGPGEYGAGDNFLGLRVPALRRLAHDYRQLGDEHAIEMLTSSWHEERLLALMLLIDGYDRGDSTRRDRIHGAYLAHTRYINNWDQIGRCLGEANSDHLDVEFHQAERIRSHFEDCGASPRRFPRFDPQGGRLDAA
jgi:DNA alkylation repair enzyme